MNRSLFLAPLAAILSLLPACSTPSRSSASTTPKPYTDHASGVVLPPAVANLDRVSLTTPDPDDPESVKKTLVTARYAAASPMLDAAVRIIPASQTSPGQLLGQTIRTLETNPAFTQDAYHGLSSFGNQTAACLQCSFDRPSSGDRVTLKVVVFPRGNFLICFTFMVQSAQEPATQDTIDAFIRDILTKSTKQILMSPEYAPLEN